VSDREAMTPFLLLASETETEREWWAIINQVRHRGRAARQVGVRGWTRGENKKDASGGLSQVRRISIGGLCWGVCLIVSLFEVSFVGDCLIGAGAASDYNRGRGMLHPCLVCDGDRGLMTSALTA